MMTTIKGDTKIQVRRQGQTWGVFIDGQLHEGGFFTRLAAQRCKDELEGQRPIDVSKLTGDTSSMGQMGGRMINDLEEGRKQIGNFIAEIEQCKPDDLALGLLEILSSEATDALNALQETLDERAREESQD